MKKIVALVLSLVMVLGLATTAFADNSVTTLKADDGYAVYLIDGNKDLYADKDITMTVTGASTASDGTVTYYATEYEVGSAKYVEVAASCATHKLVKDDAVVAYLVVSDKAAKTTAVVDEVVASVLADDATCGDYVDETASVAALARAVYIIDDVAYFAATSGSKWAVLDGTFVLYGDKVTAETHTYEKNTYAADGTLLTVKCDTCDEVFNVLSAKQVAGMAPSAYTTWEKLYIATSAVAAETPEAEDVVVESAETFDAGIAMYVGMSVMAAAGSAVVLKKKD